MARLCERPGCSLTADVLYGIDAEHLTVWIEPFDRGVDARSGVLCRRHADAMVVPLGWMLDDRRDAEPRLFRAPPAVYVDKPRRQRHAHAADDTVQLDLASVDSSAADPAMLVEELIPDDSTADHLERPVEPWRPVFDQADDLDGLLGAESPLLSRAFRGQERPRP